MSWNDENVEQLKKLWAEGNSASQIAGQLGAITRNAVIGKVHRLGLSGRATKSGAKNRKIKLRPKLNRGGAGLRPMKSPQPLPPRPLAPPTDDIARILALEPTVFGIENFEPALKRHCGYIHGEPSDQARCGRQKLDGLPYCEDHTKLCKVPIEPVRRKAPEFQTRENSYLGYARKTAADLLNA